MTGQELASRCPPEFPCMDANAVWSWLYNAPLPGAGSTVPPQIPMHGCSWLRACGCKQAGKKAHI
eukprot:1159440-Pelagomonas_calceolata.AAC.14